MQRSSTALNCAVLHGIAWHRMPLHGTAESPVSGLVVCFSVDPPGRRSFMFGDAAMKAHPEAYLGAVLRLFCSFRALQRGGVWKWTRALQEQEPGQGHKDGQQQGRRRGRG